MHSDIESCVLNNGHSTGYFPVQRGTRQGDPMAPYIFILSIEILTEMVRVNDKINGILINESELKQCIYADDTTYFLQDLESLSELTKTINKFSEYSSLCVNYEKSELAWLGQIPKLESLSKEQLNWISLDTDSIKNIRDPFLK
jgi:hypothetical protein